MNPERMEDHRQPLEVRFLWSRWTLEVTRQNGKIVGYITGQNAHTMRFDFSKDDPDHRAADEDIEYSPVDCKMGQAIPSETAEKILCGMMRKWNRINMKGQDLVTAK